MLREYLKSIADAIRYGLEMASSIKLNAQDFPDMIRSIYAKGQTRGYEEGKQAEREDFWHNIWYQADGALKPSFRCAFSGHSWEARTFQPIYPDGIIKPTGSAGCVEMFRYFNRDPNINNDLFDMTDVCKHFDFSECTQAYGTFENARIKNITADFGNCTTLERVCTCGSGGNVNNINLRVTDKCTNFNNAFTYMGNLTDIKFTDDSVIARNISFAQSTKLSKESIESIINALSVSETGRTLTLSKTAVNNAFKTEGGTTGSTSEEWLALINTKSNWTITLS